ncbi:MAG: tripartite tricarboxylate transporter substrate binding protein [Variovorax sp.]|nr:tripartite tricarboxylate transporter substrate binding protein [Variovorax sp.]
MQKSKFLGLPRRGVFLALLLGLGAATLAPVRAQEAGQPIRMIVPFAAGSSVDILARVVAEPIAHQLGQVIVIDNRAGAGGGVGAAAAAQTPPNGQNLFFGTAGTHGINASLYKKLGYDPARDFDPVAAISASANVLVVGSRSDIRTVADLVRKAKAQPDTLTMGSGGNGTTPHLSGVLLNRMADIRTVHVPYTSKAIMDVIAGRLDYSFESVPSALPFIQSGQVRAVAVTDVDRVRMLPEVPTVAEQGYPGYQIMAWVGIFAPKGSPRAFIERVNAATNKALADPALLKRLADLGSAPLGGTPEQLRQRVDFELKRWPEIVRSANVTMD